MSPVPDGEPPITPRAYAPRIPAASEQRRPAAAYRQRPPMRVARNFRWVAHAPTRTVRRTSVPRSTPIPRYTSTPQWGLLDVPRSDAPERPSFATSIGAMAPTLLIASTVAFVAAAIAEIGRYAVLLVNRHTLIQPVVLGISDAAELCLSVLSLLLGLVATVSAAFWLRDARAEAYAEAGSTDPRRQRWLIVGTLVPVLNLLMPGVFLTELARVAPRAGLERAIRWWWIAWVINWLLIIGVLLWRLQDGLQAVANGVVFTAVQDLVAAGLALLTLLVVRRTQERGLRNRARKVTRWTVAVPAVPAVPEKAVLEKAVLEKAVLEKAVLEKDAV